MASGSPRRRGALEMRAESIDFTRRVYMPAQAFIQVEWIGSALLFLAAVLALVLANSPLYDAYHYFWETHVALDLAVLEIDLSLHHWVNDGLMAVFFFLVGMEIKRELLHGALSSPRQAALPAMAALGGMVIPAGIYFVLNPSGPTANGWGIPMATDIAFALGVLGLVGPRIPTQLRVMLLALAIVDDLGAIMVIAIFYTAELSLQALGVGGLIIGLLVAMRLAGVRSFLAYWIVGFFFWIAILESGIHATIAGVVLGAMTPSRPFVKSEEYEEVAPELMTRYKQARAEGDHEEADAILGRLEEMTAESEAPLERLERKVHPWSAFVILPIFALANAGVQLSGEAVAAALTSTVTIGVAIGLFVGKPLGVLLAAWLAVKTGIAELPPRVNWTMITGVGLLAGVGFTVALFITQLAFVDQALIDQGKIGILAASAAAGVLGWVFLRFSTKETEETWESTH